MPIDGLLPVYSSRVTLRQNKIQTITGKRAKETKKQKKKNKKNIKKKKKKIIIQREKKKRKKERMNKRVESEGEASDNRLALVPTDSNLRPGQKKKKYTNTHPSCPPTETS